MTPSFSVWVSLRVVELQELAPRQRNPYFAVVVIARWASAASLNDVDVSKGRAWLILPSAAVAIGDLDIRYAVAPLKHVAFDALELARADQRGDYCHCHLAPLLLLQAIRALPRRLYA